MKDIFIIKHNLTLGEYFGILLYTIIRIKFIKFLFLFIFMMSLISTYFNLSDPLKAGDFNLILELLGLLLPFLIMILLCFLVCVLLFIAKRKYFKDVTYTFTHWGTEKKGSGFEFTSSWSKFLYYKETKRFILLYISKTDSLILQKKMFKDDAELEDFKLFISERLPRA